MNRMVLDVGIAVALFGWMRHEDAALTEKGVAIDPHGETRPTESYSFDLADAWQVVLRMQTRGWDCTMRVTWEGYAVDFEKDGQAFNATAEAREGNMALAICQAANSTFASPAFSRNVLTRG